jgi:hypothetical protein
MVIIKILVFYWSNSEFKQKKQKFVSFFSKESSFYDSKKKMIKSLEVQRYK